MYSGATRGGPDSASSDDDGLPQLPHAVAQKPSSSVAKNSARTRGKRRRGAKAEGSDEDSDIHHTEDEDKDLTVSELQKLRKLAMRARKRQVRCNGSGSSLL